jgi:hypothetical protein
VPSYRIRVKGPIGRLAASFPDLQVSTETILTGEFVDRTDLFGALDRLRDFGVDLLDVTMTETTLVERPTADRAR